MDVYEEFGVSKQETPFAIVPEKTIRKNLQGLKDYGFLEKQIQKIVSVFPATLSCSWERTLGILNNLEEYGFSSEQVIKIVCGFPTTLGCSWERTEKLLDIFQSIGFNVSNKPVRLMFSPDTLQSRINFLRIKFKIENTELVKVVFRNNKQFEKQFGISKEELLRDYLN